MKSCSRFCGAFLPAALRLALRPGPVPAAGLPSLVVTAFLFCLLAATAPALHAQYASLVPLKSVLVGGLSHPDAVVTDKSGDVYISDTLHNTVLEETFTKGTPTQHIVASGLGAPAGIAVDSNGNVYIVETANNDVLKETLSAGTYTPSIVASGLVHPYGVALDSSNNVYVSVSTGVWEYPAGGGAYSVKASGLTDPQGLAVDSNGYIFVADYANNRVLQISGSFVTPIITGLNGPRGLALDPFNNLYIADSGDGTIFKESYQSYEAYSQGILATGFSNEYGVAVDSMGNVYVADTGNNQVVRLQTAAVDFGFSQVGSPSTLTVTFKFAYGMSLQAGDVVVSTEGVAGKDFQDAGTGTCDAAATYNVGDTCTVNVNFTPTVPGLRAGSAVLLDNYGDIIATAFLHGSGIGPQVVFNPGTVSNILTGFEGQQQSSSGLAVDPSGNLFVTVNGSVNKVPAAGGAPQSLALFSSVGSAAVINGSGDLIQVEQLQFQSQGGNVSYNEQIAEVRWNGSSYISGYFLNWTTNDPNTPVLYADSRGNFYQVNADGIVEFPAGLNGGIFVAALPPDIIDSSSDGRGNLYSLLPTGSVQKTDRTHPPSLAFANTAVGSTSSDSPKSFTTTNIGNAPLVFPTPAMGVNPSISANFALDSSTTCPQIGSATPPASLAAGANCNYAIKFVPAVAGPIVGSLTLTDTNLNAMYATQTAPLSGTGLSSLKQISFSPATADFGNTVVGTTSQSISVTITNGLGSPAYFLASSNLSTIHIQAGTCLPTSPAFALAPGASCTFSANFSPTAIGQVVGHFRLKAGASFGTFELKGYGVSPR